MASKPTIELLVLATTSDKDKAALLKQIAALHPTRTEDDIAVLVWDRKDAPHAGVKPRMWRYASAEVYTAYLGTDATASFQWEQYWKVVSEGILKRKLAQWQGGLVAMYLCQKGLPNR